MVKLRVFLPADAEQAEVDQADSARGYPVTIEAAAVAKISQGGGPQRGQSAGKAEHVRELLDLALLTPDLVVEVLGASPCVEARGLNVIKRFGRNPDISPGWRDGERCYARQRPTVSNLFTGRFKKPEAVAGPLARNPGPVQVTAGQSWNCCGGGGYAGAQRAAALTAAWSRSHQEVLPVGGDPSGRSRYGLVDGMMLRRCEARPLKVFVRSEVPKPIFAWLETADDRVTRRLGMRRGVLAGRVVATPYVPALGTPP